MVEQTLSGERLSPSPKETILLRTHRIVDNLRTRLPSKNVLAAAAMGTFMLLFPSDTPPFQIKKAFISPTLPHSTTISDHSAELSETLKSIPPTIVMIDFFSTEVEGVGLKEEPTAKYIEEDELTKKFGLNFSRNLATLAKVAKEYPDVALAYGVWEMYQGHGRQVAQVLRQTLSRLGYRSPIEAYPLPNVLTSDRIELTQDELGNRNYSVEINPDAIIEVLKGYPDQKVVNMSFQVGKLGLDLMVTNNTPHIRFTEAYTKDKAQENLSELFRICKAFPDKLFIVAAGNLEDDLTAIDQPFPKNLLTVAEWNGRTDMPQAEVLGADIYVDNSSFGAPPGSSFSVPVIGGIIQALLNQGLSIEEAKAKAFQITTPGRFETHGRNQEVRVLDLQRLQISNNYAVLTASR